MDDKTIYLILSCVLLLISEIMPFLPTQYKGIVQAGIDGGQKIYTMLVNNRSDANAQV